jgi:hypothetical protein
MAEDVPHAPLARRAILQQDRRADGRDERVQFRGRCLENFKGILLPEV